MHEQPTQQRQVRRVISRWQHDDYLHVMTDDGLCFQWNPTAEEWESVLVTVPIPQFDVEQPMFILPKHAGETLVLQTWKGSAIKIDVFTSGELRLTANTNFRTPTGLDLSPGDVIPTVLLPTTAALVRARGLEAPEAH